MSIRPRAHHRLLLPSSARPRARTDRRPAATAIVLSIVLVLVATSLAAAAPQPLRSERQRYEVIRVTASADAHVSSAAQHRNNGASPTLRVDSEPAVMTSYLRFDVPNRTIVRAVLHVRAKSSSASGRVRAHPSSGPWTEDAITFATAPSVGARVSSDVAQAGRRIDLRVGSIIEAEADLNIALTTPERAQINLASREATTDAPVLELVVKRTKGGDPSPSPTPTPQPSVSPSPSPGSQPALPIRAAFYYPWFPEAWDQSGFDPFTNYTPSLGWYDSGSASVIQQHIQAMQYGGVEAGIASWWGRGSRTDGRITQLLNVAENTDFRWSLYYENESLTDPSASQIQGDLAYIRDSFGTRPAYLRIDGKPVVFVYADADDGCGMADRWKTAGAGMGLYVVLKVFNGFKSCASQPQGWHQYSPAVDEADHAPYSFAISPGFWLKGQSVRLERDLERWNANVRHMEASGATFELITTFNEWGEGTSVENAIQWSQDGPHGAYLEALHDDGTSTLPTSPSPSPSPTSTPTTSPAPSPSPPGDGSAPVLAAVGDIACDPADGNFKGGAGTENHCRQMATSDLVLNRPGVDQVAVLGDLQYEDGTLIKFQQSYDPSWGRLRSITRPAAGNHEYQTPGAAGYYSYFGSAAGDPAKGYYSYNLGDWHIIVLNTNCSQVGGCHEGSPQEQWLLADLAATPRECTLAYWHHPRWSSGKHGDHTWVDPFVQALYDADADVILSGHDHSYERFAKQTPAGAADPVRGIRQWVVGTGGKNRYPLSEIRPNSQVRDVDTYGVLFLTLHTDSYDWEFQPEPGKTFTDSGSSPCH